MWSGQHGCMVKGPGNISIEHAMATGGRGQKSWESCGLMCRPPTINKPGRNIWNRLGRQRGFGPQVPQSCKIAHQISPLINFSYSEVQKRHPIIPCNNVNILIKLLCLTGVSFINIQWPKLKNMKSADDVLFSLSPVLQLIHFPLTENKQDSGYLSHILPLGWVHMMSPSFTPHPYRLVTCVILCHVGSRPGNSPHNVSETCGLGVNSSGLCHASATEQTLWETEHVWVSLKMENVTSVSDQSLKSL